MRAPYSSPTFYVSSSDIIPSYLHSLFDIYGNKQEGFTVYQLDLFAPENDETTLDRNATPIRKFKLRRDAVRFVDAEYAETQIA